MDFFYLTDYCRSVTIVTKTKTTFFTRKIGQLHPKTGQFRHFFGVKNVVNFSNSSRQYSVKHRHLTLEYLNVPLVQTANDPFEPEIPPNSPQNYTFQPFIRLKELVKSFGIVQFTRHLFSSCITFWV